MTIFAQRHAARWQTLVLKSLTLRYAMAWWAAQQGQSCETVPASVQLAACMHMTLRDGPTGLCNLVMICYIVLRFKAFDSFKAMASLGWLPSWQHNNLHVSHCFETRRHLDLLIVGM